MRTYFADDREAGPGDRHRPGLNAAVAIEPLFQRHFANEIVEPDLLRLLYHAVDLDRPGAQLERLRRLGDVLAHAEFVEIVVVEIDLLFRDRAVERERLVALDRIEILGRIRQVADALRARNARRQHQRGRAGRRQEGAPVEQVLRRGKAFRDFPSAAANDVHGDRPPDSGDPFDTPTGHHGQVSYQ
jgi:hypothetical protein